MNASSRMPILLLLYASALPARPAVPYPVPRSPATDSTTPCQQRFAIQLDKMNVFYIGIDNPVTVFVEDAHPDKVTIHPQGVRIRKAAGCGRYIVNASQPGQASLTIGSVGSSDSTTLRFRVKRIPDPVPKLGARYVSGRIPNGVFKAQAGIAMVLENFDFDVRCDVVGFEVTYLAKRSDAITQQNTGARWSRGVADLIARAKPGDVYFFDSIKCRCPGDATARIVGNLAFQIR